MLLSLASSTGHLLSWFWTHSFLFHCISGKVSGYLSDEGSLKQNKLFFVSNFLCSLDHIFLLSCPDKLKIMKAQDGRLLAHFFSFCFLPENAFDPSCSCIFDRIKSFKDTLFSFFFIIWGVNRSGVEARVLASNPWAWVLFSVLMSRRVDLVWRWFSFLSKSFLLGSLVYLCKRTNTPLLLPRTAQREGEGGASDPHLFRRKTCPA